MIKSLPIIEDLDISLNLALQGKADESEAILKSLDKNDPRVSFNFGWHHMRHGRLLDGFLGLERGREAGIFGGSIPPIYCKRYNGEDIKGKMLLFVCEGGLGDEIINVRFVKNYQQLGAKVMLASSPEFYPVFKNIPDLQCLLDRRACNTTYADYWVPGMVAAMHLKLEYKDLSGEPYLNYFSPRYFPNKEKKLKVGLRWSGNPKFEHEQHRKFPIEKMLKLTEIENCKFYSLQRDNDLIEKNNPLIDLRYEMKSWKDTAEIIMGMDLIITSCTSIAHMSAAMGKPTWIIIPALPYYIWAVPGEKSPWYNSVKLYRQKEYGNWDSVFEKIYNDLKDHIQNTG